MDDTDAIALSVSIDGKATVGVDSGAAEEEDDAQARVDRARAEGETAVGDEPRPAAEDDSARAQVTRVRADEEATAGVLVVGAGGILAALVERIGNTVHLLKLDKFLRKDDAALHFAHQRNCMKIV